MMMMVRKSRFVITVNIFMVIFTVDPYINPNDNYC